MERLQGETGPCLILRSKDCFQARLVALHDAILRRNFVTLCGLLSHWKVWRVRFGRPDASRKHRKGSLIAFSGRRGALTAFSVAVLFWHIHLLPLGASWSDTNADGVSDTWTNPVSQIATTLTAMDLQNLDVDGDGATNLEEAQEGSNPFVFDTDMDGFGDGDELHIVRLVMPVSLTTWDSDGDSCSDWDEYYQFYDVQYPGGILPSYAGATYYDYDGDGYKNPDDPAPYDPSNTSYGANGATYYWNGNALGDDDGDGIVNFNDYYPYTIFDDDNDGVTNVDDPAPQDVANYSTVNNREWYDRLYEDADGDGVANWWDYMPEELPLDSDSDGFPDSYDPAPLDLYNTSSINGLSWDSWVYYDNDWDGLANFWDPYPDTPIDTDGDGIGDQMDPFAYDSDNLSWYNGIKWYGEVLGDADLDGLPNHLDTLPYGPDADGDGLGYVFEMQHGLNDLDVDCDDDGLSDYEELMVYYTDPSSAYDLSNRLGWGALYTDYFLVDTADQDSDEIPDRIEVHFGLDPLNLADAQGDLDSNGLTNLAQYQAGIALDVDLVAYDSDLDGMTDVFENSYGLDPNNADDAIGDPDGDGVLNYEEARLLLSPFNANSLSALHPGWAPDIRWLMEKRLYPANDAPSVDSDGDGVPDWAESALTSSNPVFTRVSPGDLDGDGMSDLWEHRYGKWRYPAKGLDLRVNDSQMDPDQDGLVNLVEHNLGTHPLMADTDADGVTDANEDQDGDTLSNSDEVLLGLNPALADSDGDGVGDKNSAPPNDPDRDGLVNSAEMAQGRNPAWKDHPAVWLSAAGFSTP